MPVMVGRAKDLILVSQSFTVQSIRSPLFRFWLQVLIMNTSCGQPVSTSVYLANQNKSTPESVPWLFPTTMPSLLSLLLLLPSLLSHMTLFHCFTPTCCRHASQMRLQTHTHAHTCVHAHKHTPHPKLLQPLVPVSLPLGGGQTH